MRTKSLGLAVAVILTLAAFTFGPGVRADTEAMEVEIAVAPNVVYMASQGVWVTVHAEISYYAVEGCTVTLNGLPVEFTKSDSRGQLVAKFTLDSVKSILTPGANALTLQGLTTSGVKFQGTDSIRVIVSKK